MSKQKCRVLVCGDRHWKDHTHLEEVLDTYNDLYKFTAVIHGCAPGADTMAGNWAEFWELDVCPYPADWSKYGKSAGPIRNQQMLKEGKPDIVIAFHDHLRSSKGTKDMARRALKAGIPVFLCGHKLDKRLKLEDVT